MYPFIYFIYLSIYLSIYLFIYLFAYLSIFLFFSVYTVLCTILLPPTLTFIRLPLFIFPSCFLTGQAALQRIILSQLEKIEKKASTIIFFNEPLSHFDDTHYPYVFPYDALGQYLPTIDKILR